MAHMQGRVVHALDTTEPPSSTRTIGSGQGHLHFSGSSQALVWTRQDSVVGSRAWTTCWCACGQRTGVSPIAYRRVALVEGMNQASSESVQAEEALDTLMASYQ
jgi:hypothetical protein